MKKGVLLARVSQLLSPSIPGDEGEGVPVPGNVFHEPSVREYPGGIFGDDGMAAVGPVPSSDVTT